MYQLMGPYTAGDYLDGYHLNAQGGQRFSDINGGFLVNSQNQQRNYSVWTYTNNILFGTSFEGDNGYKLQVQGSQYPMKMSASTTGVFPNLSVATGYAAEWGFTQNGAGLWQIGIDTSGNLVFYNVANSRNDFQVIGNNISLGPNGGQVYLGRPGAGPQFQGNPAFSTGNTTGAGTALLGANSPAVSNTAPYKWLTVVCADGSTCYIPAWK
jgi:hypothetical protein